MIRDSLTELIGLLDSVGTSVERAEAVALMIAAPTTPGDFARFLAARAHVIVRGGARALIREMLSTITAPELEVSVLADIAEEHVRASNHDFGVRFVRVASTRAAVSIGRGPQRYLTIETHGHEIGGLHFSPDGTRLVAFVSSLIGWDPAMEESLGGSCIAQWDATTGQFLGAVRAGQFREGNGAMGVNPSMTLAAVRSHREIAIHALEGKKRSELRRIRLDEGPHEITFLDDRILLTNNAYEVILADAETGDVVRRASSVGRAFVHSAKHERVFVGGSSASGVSIAAHDAATLDLLGSAAMEGRTNKRGLIETIALSPAEDTIATGDWDNEVRLWTVRDVLSDERAKPVRSVLLGKHGGWVSGSAFVDDQRLLTAGWDGALIEWNLQRREAVHRAHGHNGYVTAFAVDATARQRAATGASDGRIVIWNLASELGEAPPPFVVSYGGHRSPLAMTLEGEEVRIALGKREAVFDRSSGKLLRTGECALPEDATFEGFISDEIDVEVEAFDTPEAEWACKDDAPSLVVSSDGKVQDVVGLDATARAFIWVDTDALLVLDSAGHVELWARRR